MNKNEDDLQLLRDVDIAKMIGISRSTLWSWTKRGKFPKPLPCGSHQGVRCARWSYEQVHNWIYSGPAE